MNRVTLMLIAGAAFGGPGQSPLAAQTAPGPVLPSRPSPPVATPQPLGSNASAAMPGQTKIVMIYRGQGRFDAGLARKLQPVLARDLGQPMSGSETNPLNWLKSMSGYGTPASDSPSPPRAAGKVVLP